MSPREKTTSTQARFLISTLFLSLLLCLPAGPARASTAKAKETKSAIVLAHFGTTVPSGLAAINHITETVKKAYPATEIRTTFTSNLVRNVWRKRQAEPQKWFDQGVPPEILQVKNIIATIGDLLEEGYTDIIVQPSHMFYMEQSYDLQQYVEGLASITTMKKRWKPFNQLVMGRPALGMPGDSHPYHQDIEAVVATLAADAEMARKAGAALVYMGHGNENWPSGIYQETEKKMRETYPDVATYIGVVEGYPTLDDLLERLQRENNRKVLLKPFMIVAGDHSVNDMAGEEEDSWKSRLTKAGFEVEPVLEGLGSNDDFARIFVDHIADVAKDHNITLQ